MKVAVLGGDGYCGWATALYLSKQRALVSPLSTASRAGSGTMSSAYRRSLRFGLFPTVFGPGTSIPVRPSSIYVGDVTDYEFLAATISEFRARSGHSLRRAALGSLLDDRPPARLVHPGQQRGRHAQPALCASRTRSRMPPDQARHHGRIRHAEHRYRRGLHHHRAQRPQGRAAVSQAARLLLSPVQGARQPQHHVRLQGLEAARHRSESGRGLRHRHRRIRAGRSADQSLRLRRSFRHRAKPLLRRGRRRPSAHRVRQGRAKRAASWTFATPCAASSWPVCIRPRPASVASTTSSPSSSPCWSWRRWCRRPRPNWA